MSGWQIVPDVVYGGQIKEVNQFKLSHDLGSLYWFLWTQYDPKKVKVKRL